MTTERYGCIYRIWHIESGMSYIGRTIQPIAYRINAHFAGKQGCRRITHAIKKYGADAFKHEMLEDNIPVNSLSEREIYWIKHFNSVSPNGYNLTHGGDGPGVPSTETRERLSEAGKGKTVSKETRQKISDTLKGQPFSVERRKNISESQRGEKHRLYGKHHSEDTKRKISEAQKGQKRKPLSEEHKRKLSELQKGRNNPNWGKRKSNKTSPLQLHLF